MSTRCCISGETSTLPPSEGDILTNFKLVPVVHKLQSGQRLGENINNLLVGPDVLELHCSSLYNVSDVMIFDLYVLRPVMEYWILRKLDAALVITMDHGRL